MTDEEIELIKQLQDLAITKRQIESQERTIHDQIKQIRQKRARPSKPAFNGFQLGDRVIARTSGTLNIRTGTVIGVTHSKITYRGDCGTKTWRAPKNLKVIEREQQDAI